MFHNPFVKVKRPEWSVFLSVPMTRRIRILITEENPLVLLFNKDGPVGDFCELHILTCT